ncbi:tail fiber domain-containing protein [uncultured Flavobacterium sp.]|uniref:tail fiber domain-containing protein n=1 Tax=uncultured Flavobacterium sp. TaxID=165435 RepID=UPI0025E31329|nr:tail fiber domain-containing protein [uncultured Flavobacterium sp.]
MKKQLYTIAALLIIGITANAQVGIGTTTPDGSSMLDVTSTTKGLLAPRLTTANRDAIVTPGPANGLVIYNTTTNRIEVNIGTPAAPNWQPASGTPSAYVEPWFNQATGTGATSNTQNIYQLGNVGIGTSAPGVPLEVSNYSGGGRGRIMLSNYNSGTAMGSGAYIGDVLFSASDGSGTIPSGTGAVSNISGITTENWSSTAHGSALNFRVIPNGTISAISAMRIDHNGNVGIGTTTPAQLLHVRGALPQAIITSPSVPAANGFIGLVGMGANNGGASDYQSAGINAYATEAWTTSASGSRLSFVTTGNGTTSRLERMTVDQNGNVGIGTTTPSAPLDITSSTTVPFVNFSRNTNLTATSSNIGGFEFRALDGSGSYFTGASITGSIGSLAPWSATNHASQFTLRTIKANDVTTNNGNLITMDANGAWLPGTYNATTNANQTIGTSLNRWSTAYFNTAPTITSDGRLKTNIKNVGYGLADVMKMRPVTYNWKTDPDHNHMVGFIAQEMEKIIPEAVEAPKSENDHYGVRYEELIPVLTKAIQEQQAQIDALKKHNEASDLAYAKLAAQVKELKEALNKK